MADQNENEEVKDGESKEQVVEETAGNSSKVNIVMWAILATVILIGFSGGYGAAKIFASPDPQIDDLAKQQQEEEEKKAEEPLVEPTQEDDNSWEFSLDTVIANLDEPGVTRYVRAALLLRISNDLPEAEYRETLESKRSELVDWLYSYMAGLSLEDVQGTRNLERFKLEVQKNFNDLLFPDSKPMIVRILTKEFQIQ